MGQSKTDNFKINAPKVADARYYKDGYNTPYASRQEAFDLIYYKAKKLSCAVMFNGVETEFWFKDSFASPSDLVIKNPIAASSANLVDYSLKTLNTIYNVIDQYTGELVTYNKVTTYTSDSGSTVAIGDAQVDGVVFKKVGNEYFERNIPNGIINLAWYGVLGNGSNEHDKIQKAINVCYKKTLWIPKGIFHTTKLEGINDITIDGVGVLKAHSSMPLYDCTLLFIGKSNFKVLNIGFDGSKGVVPGDDQQGSPNIIISNCSDGEIDGIKVKDNAYVAVAIYNSDRIKTNGGKYINTDCGVIHNGGDDWECIGNYAEGGTSDGFIAWGAPDKFCTNVSMRGNRVKNKVIAYELRYVKGFDVSGNFADDCTNGVGSQPINDIAFDGKITSNTCNNCTVGVSGVFNDTVIQSNNVNTSIFHGIVIGVLGRNDLISKNVKTFKNILKDNTTSEERGWGIVYHYVEGGEIDSNIIKDTKDTVLTNNSILVSGVSRDIKVTANDTEGSVEGIDIKIESAVIDSQVYGNNGIVVDLGTSTPVLYKTQVAGKPATDSAHFIVKAQLDEVTPLDGTATRSGDGVTTDFSIPHGLGNTPSFFITQEASFAAKNISYVTADATDLTVHYDVAPVAGVNNIIIIWQAKLSTIDI